MHFDNSVYKGGNIMDMFNAKTLEQADSSNKKRVKIQVFTHDATFNGYMCCSGSMRLLDVLNGGVGSFCSDSRFVCISRCENDTDDINELQKNAAQINKSKILFLRETQMGNETEKLIKKNRNAYPYVEKTTTLCRVKMMSYTLEGYVHHLKGQGINDILNCGSHFLPMTDVKINSEQEGVMDEAGFVAVNKGQISYLENVFIN